jgi:DNA-binding transcriptional LysR family regulator
MDKPKPPRRYKELRLEQLRAFIECARRRSYSAAARALQRSQPAVWQQVHALERDLGVPLLQRRGRECTATEDGGVLLELAADLLGSVDSLRERFAVRRQEIERPLVVIGTPGVVTEELARPVVRFCKRHPEVRLALLNYAGLRSLDALLSGEADLAVLPLASEVASQRQLLEVEPLHERPWVLAAPPGHRLLRQRRVSLVDLARYPLILPEHGSNWRVRLDDRFRAAGLLDSLQVACQVSLTLAARRDVSQGLGVALLPLPRDSLKFARLATRPLGDLLPAEAIVLAWRRGSKPRPPARQFADYVLAELRG